MRKKLFSKHTPESRGRMRITIDVDAVYIREVYDLLGDAPKAIADRMPMWKAAFEKIAKAMEN